MSLPCCGGVVVLMLLTACGPSEQQKAAFAERVRIECMDKVCEGDAPPKVDPQEFVLKLNGQYFVAPRRYVQGLSGIAFYWPSKTPLTGSLEGLAYPERGEKFADVAIEIFLRSHDGVMHGPNRYDRLLQAQAEGRLISKETPRAGLEIWHTREIDGLGPGLWYVASEYVAADPNGTVLSCRGSNLKFATCVTGFKWRPGIAADMRFRAKHSVDWPEIYQEAIRVLQQLRKA
jgi:hypothetical protein